MLPKWEAQGCVAEGQQSTNQMCACTHARAQCTRGPRHEKALACGMRGPQAPGLVVVLMSTRVLTRRVPYWDVLESGDLNVNGQEAGLMAVERRRSALCARISVQKAQQEGVDCRTRSRKGSVPEDDGELMATWRRL
eukprot:290272-Chlamydomonas_euryale.AAC.3